MSTPPLPRPRTPLSARRCTCQWDLIASRRTLPDPFCPARVLHRDPTEEEIQVAVERAVAGQAQA